MKRLFGRQAPSVPELNTSSLPDLIFTVLFFFMIVTHMRQVDPMVSYRVPHGSEVQKLGHKSAVSYIYIGRPTSFADSTVTYLSATGEGFCLQLNNRLATVSDIRQFIAAERERMSSEDQGRMTISIKADRDVPMGVIADVKQALQQSFALRINYSATEK